MLVVNPDEVEKALFSDRHGAKLDFLEACQSQGDTLHFPDTVDAMYPDEGRQQVRRHPGPLWFLISYT